MTEPWSIVAIEALPEAERLRFLDMCTPRSADDLHDDMARIRTHVSVIETAARSDTTIDVSLARKIGEVLVALAEAADGFDFSQRRLLAGAITYFVRVGDEADDYRHPRGLVDDARVARATCRVLGRPDLAKGW